MKIIKMGQLVPDEYKVTCKKCGCIFIYEDSDIKNENDGPYYSSYVICPCCGGYINHDYKNKVHGRKKVNV